MILQNLFIRAATKIEPYSLPKASGSSGDLEALLGIVFNIAGALALLVIVISGLRYIFAGGEAQKISKAKNGVIYALVGLVVVVIARAIVTFVVNRV